MRTVGEGSHYCVRCGFDCTPDPRHARRGEAVALECCPACDGDLCEPKKRYATKPKKQTGKKGQRRTMMRVEAPAGSKDILYGQPPFGWKLSQDRSKLVRAPEEQRTIALIRKMYFVERIPMRAIEARLRTLRVVNRRGNAFPLSRICEILHTEGKPEEAKGQPDKKSKRRAA